MKVDCHKRICYGYDVMISMYDVITLIVYDVISSAYLSTSNALYNKIVHEHREDAD